MTIDLLENIDYTLLVKHQAFPLKIENNELVLLIAKPSDSSLFFKEFYRVEKIKEVLTPNSEIIFLIQEYFHKEIDYHSKNDRLNYFPEYRVKPFLKLSQVIFLPLILFFSYLKKKPSQKRIQTFPVEAYYVKDHSNINFDLHLISNEYVSRKCMPGSAADGFFGVNQVYRTDLARQLGGWNLELTSEKRDFELELRAFTEGYTSISDFRFDLQLWLIYNRNPIKLLKKMGFKRWIIFQQILLGRSSNY